MNFLFVSGSTEDSMHHGVFGLRFSPETDHPRQVVGENAIRALTRDNVEAPRQARPRPRRKGDWALYCAQRLSVLTGALKSAYAARERSLRVIEAPMHFGVLPPKRGDARQRPSTPANKSGSRRAPQSRASGAKRARSRSTPACVRASSARCDG